MQDHGILPRLDLLRIVRKPFHKKFLQRRQRAWSRCGAHIITAWRMPFRKAPNAADNKAATVAVDSLINYDAGRGQSRRSMMRLTTELFAITPASFR